jgi:hypothetical protein
LAIAAISRGISALVTSSSAVGSSGGRDMAPAKQTSVTPCAERFVEQRAEPFEPRRDPARAGGRDVDAREGHHMGRRPRQKQLRQRARARDDRPRAHAAQPGVR